jgi:polyisoprenoid-binding protein YceI
MKTRLIALLLALLWFLPSNAFARDWMIDIDHSAAHFRVEHMTIAKVGGHFADLTGTGTFDDNTGKLTGLKIRIGVASIDTGVVKRDDHLRSKDFFKVDSFKAITFEAKEITEAKDSKGKVVGNLTIKGITREVTLDLHGPTKTITDPWGNLRKGAKLTTTIDRTDFGITYNNPLTGGGVTIGTEVEIEADLEFLILNPKLVK